MRETRYCVTIPARGKQTFLVEGASSKAHAVRMIKEHTMGESPCHVGKVEAITGEFDVLYYSRAVVDVDD